jgi:hypothetical protein
VSKPVSEPLSEPVRERATQAREVVSVTVKGAPAASDRPRISRREAIQWVMGAVAASAAVSKFPATARAQNQESPADLPSGRRKFAPQERGGAQPPPDTHAGYGTDPNLTKEYKPGDVWPLTFNDAQKKTATALADLIIPADDLGPAASTVGVVEMLDEWISAPYPHQRHDHPRILEGLAWLDAQAGKRFKKNFAALDDRQMRSICDQICYVGAAQPELREPAMFFSRFRTICASAYYATPAGWKAIGYVGNIPLASFDGPPPEVLERLGVTQTVG